MTPATHFTHLIKRDGALRPFDAAKIVSALARAGLASGEFGADEAARLTHGLVLPSLHALGPITPHVEQVQDAAEAALFEAGWRKTLRAYTVYREQHRKLRDARRTLVDVEASMTEYLQQRDWRVNANANQGYSLGGLILNVSGKVVANYWLDHVYPPEAAASHRNADLHIHDLDMLSGYCAGWSLAHAAARRPQRRAGQGGIGPAAAPEQRGRADRQLPGHAAERMGRRPGLQRPSTPTWRPSSGKDRLSVRPGAPVHPGTCLQPERALALGHADALHQPHLRLGLPRGPARAGAHHRRQARLPFCYGDLQAEMDLINRAYIEVMMRRRRQGPRLHLPHPHLQHHQGLRLAQPER